MEILNNDVNNASSSIDKSILFQQIGIWKLDIDTLKITFDDDIIDMLKYMGFENVSSEYTLLAFSEKYIHPEDIQFVQSRYKEIIKNKDLIDYNDRFEYRVIGLNKIEYSILVKAVILQPGFASGSIQNLTDVKSFESKFRNKEIDFRSVLNSSSDYVFTVTAEGRFILWNDAYDFAVKKYFNKSLEVGMMAFDILPIERQTEWVSVLNDALKGIEVSFELNLELDKKYFYNVVANPIKGVDDTIQGVTFWVKDITDKKLIEDIDRLEGKVLGFAMQNPSIDDALYLLLTGIEDLFSSLKTYVTVLDPHKYELKWLSAPRIPASYLLAIPSIPIGPAYGSCGAAAFSRKPIFTKDIASAESWKSYRDISLLNGFRACFSIPIINPHGILIGTLGSYLNESRDLTTNELELIERGVKLAGLLLDRQNAIDKAIYKQNQLHELSKFIPGVIYESKALPTGERKFTYVSDSSVDFLGFKPDDFIKNYDLIWKCIHTDDIEIVSTSLLLSIKTVTPWNCEFRAINFITKKERWLKLTAEHLRNDDGSFSSYGAIYDIQIQKETEQILLEKQKELSAIISSIDDLVFEMSEGGRFRNVWTNDETRLAIPKEDFLGKNILEVLGEERSIQYFEAVKLVLETGKPQSFEFSMLLENKTLFFKAKVDRIKKSSDINKRIYVSIKDITELKLIEEDSFNMQRILKEAGKLAKVGAFEFDIQTKEIIWSDELYSIFPISNSIKGIHLYDAFFNTVHPDDLILVKKTIDDAINKNENYEIVHRIIMANGTIKYVLGRGKVRLNLNGDVVSIHGVVQDITAFKEAQLQSLENSEKYYSLFLNSGEAILLTSPDGRIFSANPEACKIFGRNEREICEIGRNGLVDINNPIILKAFEKRKQFGFFSGELPFIRKDGTEFIGEISSSVFHDSRGEERTSIIIRDITKRKSTELLIQENLKEKELLLSEIHHRVKNNLSIISSLLQLQQLYTKDTTIRTMLKDTQSRLKSMALVHEKLYQFGNFSRLDFGIYINEISNHIKKAFANPEINVTILNKAQSHNLEITSAVPCGLILNELLTNAFKYAFVGRTSGEIIIHFDKNGGYFSLKVEDNGQGFPDTINFEKPISLGFTLIKTLTEQLKGKLDVKSEKNKGLSITITFPEASSR